jgi:hypothetical protein
MTLDIDLHFDRVTIWTTPRYGVVITRPSSIAASQWLAFWEYVMQHCMVGR